MTTTTVQNTITDPAGNPIVGAAVRITLITSTAGNTPGLTAASSVTAPKTVYTNSAGLWTAPLTPNSEITQPAGTYYQVNEGGYTSTITVPVGGGPYNLAALLVATPPSPTAQYLAATQKGAAGGVATLDGTGNVPASQLGNASTIPTLPVYYADDYGATGNGTTNDGPAFVAAWTALVNSGSDGYLGMRRKAKYRVLLDSLIVHGVGDQYAALPIPLVAHNTATPMRVLGIVGPGKALVGRQFGNGADVAGPFSNAIIQLDYTAPFAWSPTYGLPSFVGGPDYDHSTQGLSNVHFVVKGVHIRQPDNPSVCNLNLEGVQCATVLDYFADTTAYPDQAADPTHPTGCAILWPAPGNAAVVRAGDVGCWGYFAGVGHGEHLLADYVYAVRNRLGHPVRRPADHHCTFTMTVSEENRWTIAGYDPSSATGVVKVPSTSQAVWVFTNLDLEDFPAGPNGEFYARTAGGHVHDPDNALRGYANFAGINSGTVAPVGRNDSIVGTGAASFRFISLLDGNRKTVTATGRVPSVPGTTIPGAPTIGTATAGNASATVAFTPPASNGGDTIISYTAVSTPGSVTASGTTSPITVTGLTNGTAYTFQVKASNNNGSGASSAASNSVTPNASTQSIFTTQTPTTPNATDGPYTLGTLFTSTQIGQVNGIRWFFPTTVPTQPVIGVLYRWDSELAGTELARATFTTPTAGAWNTVTFTTPVSIAANTKYVAAVWTSDRYVSTAGFFTGASVTNGPLTAPADDAITPLRNGRFNSANSATAPSYPNVAAGGACYFVDVIFQ